MNAAFAAYRRPSIAASAARLLAALLLMCVVPSITVGVTYLAERIVPADAGKPRHPQPESHQTPARFVGAAAPNSSAAF
jgi:hypothetical protein